MLRWYVVCLYVVRLQQHVCSQMSRSVVVCLTAMTIDDALSGGANERLGHDFASLLNVEVLSMISCQCFDCVIDYLQQLAFMRATHSISSHYCTVQASIVLYFARTVKLQSKPRYSSAVVALLIILFFFDVTAKAQLRSSCIGDNIFSCGLLKTALTINFLKSHV